VKQTDLHAVSGGDTVAVIDQGASTDEREPTAGSSSLDLGMPRPRVRLRLHAADDPEEDTRLYARDTTLVLVLHILTVLIVVEQLHNARWGEIVGRYNTPDTMVDVGLRN